MSTTPPRKIPPLLLPWSRHAWVTNVIVVPQAYAKRIRPIAVTSEKRMSALPGTPNPFRGSRPLQQFAYAAIL